MPQSEIINDCINLLETNYNIILTGAPGTGKTYLAKQIAKQMIFGLDFSKDEKDFDENERNQFKEQCEFVQFHPSYDYTDFVEGLRPKQDNEDDNIGFKLQDGIFKDFCKRAKQNLINSQKKPEVLQKEQFLKEKLNIFLDEALENETEFPYERGKRGEKNSFIIIKHPSEDFFYAKILNNETIKKQLIPKIEVIKVFERENEVKKATDIQKIFNTRFKYQYTFIFQIVELLREDIKEHNIKSIEVQKEEKKDFIFIIDEINRGEISKIFGELFFSIDPGYRGIKGAVETQYQNMHDDEGDFYVPENVYIIGTMNDIDRSVESFDFAMRRRFTWKEITAKESQKMLEDESWKDEAIRRMDSLNNAIWNEKEKKGIDGLNSSYHIGASYFKTNLPKYEESERFEKLWKYHLEPLLKEYLRGMSDAETQLENLKKAYYFDETTANNE